VVWLWRRWISIGSGPAKGFGRSGGAVPQRLVAVEIERGSEATRSSALTVVLRNGRRIEVGGAFDAGLLSELLVVLEQA